MYNQYFCLFPSKNTHRLIETKQYHSQDQSRSELTFDISIIKDEYKVFIHERSFHYSDFDGYNDDYSTYDLRLAFSEQTEGNMTVFYIDEENGRYLSSNDYDIEKGYITFVSSQFFLMDEKELEIILWKILYLFKYQISTRFKSYGARELKQCDLYINSLLKYFLAAKDDEAHFLLFHKFYYYGDQYGGIIEEKAKEYQFNDKELFSICKDLIDKIDNVVEEFVIPLELDSVSEGLLPHNVKNVVFHEGIVIIESNAFYSNPCIKRIILPDSVEEIKFGAFNYCYGLEELKLSSSLTTIESSAFNGCRSLKGVLNIPTKVKFIGSSAFSGCRCLTKINLPEGLEKIGRNAFRDCENVESIVIPSTVKYIGNDAFKGCKNLRKVIMPSYIATEHLFGYSMLDKEEIINYHILSKEENRSVLEKIFDKIDFIEFEIVK